MTTTSPPPSQQPTKPRESLREQIAPRVFIPAAAIILVFVAYGAIGTDSFSNGVLDVKGWIENNFNWYYVLLVTALVVLALVIGFSRFGNIRLGKQNEKPEFGLFSWFSMLFAAGMGIGLVFWGVAEPLNYLVAPRPGVDPESEAAGSWAMTQTLFHWGLHAWGIYVVVGLAIAYTVHRRGRPLSIRYALEPLLGDRVNGWIGDAIDVIAIVATLFGVATSLGLGASQIGAGFVSLGWADADAGNGLLIGIIIVITLIATTSVVSGVKRGIKWLSTGNMYLAGAFLLFVFIAGPTLFIFRESVESIGHYLQNVVNMSFNVGNFYGESGEGFINGWTVFYWGWWMSWAPFVGVFIARISRGRTVREFVTGVLLVPVLVTIVWFSVMGGSALHRQMFGDGGLINEVDGEQVVDNTGSLYQLLDGFPLSSLVTVIAIVLITIFFVTSSDSGSLVVDMLASGGDPNPPTWSRIFWAFAEGGVAIVLLLAGSEGDALNALQAGSITLALPFSIVIVLMMIATWKALSRDHLQMQEAEDREKAEVFADQVTATFGDHVADAVAEANQAGGVATKERTQAPPASPHWWNAFVDKLKERPGSPLE